MLLAIICLLEENIIMKNKSINLTGIDTPVGGFSVEITPSTAIEIKRIFNTSTDRKSY